MAFVLALVLLAVFVALDISSGADRVATGSFVIAPLIAAVLCSPRQTVIVAIAAVVCAGLSSFWTADSSLAVHGVRQALVVTGSVVSVFGARARARAESARLRLELLEQVAAVSDAGLGLPETARRIVELMVPRVTDLCAIDVVRDGRVERIAVRVDGPRSEELERGLTERVARTNAEGGRSPSRFESIFVGAVDAPFLDSIAIDEADRRLLERVGMRSIIVVPLRARGEAAGGLVLAVTDRSGRHFVRDDVAFARTLGGRVALALDNAGLSSDLAEAERRMGVALGAMGSGVLIQRVDKGLVYANQAAADLLGRATPQDVLSASVSELAAEWDIHEQDGRPLQPDRYPSGRILSGKELHPATLITHRVHRQTGRERWMATRATPVLDDDGTVLMAVSVTDDITAIKRAELVQRLLANAGQALTASLDVDEMLRRLAALVVPDVADWCSILVPGEDGVLRQAAVAHRDAARVAASEARHRRFPVRSDTQSSTAEVLRTGRTLFVEEIDAARLAAEVPDPGQRELVTALGMRSLIQVPLLASGGAALGVMSLVTAESRRVFTSADVAVAEELGRRAGVALQNAELYDERARVAATLQDSLLPDELPAVPGMVLAATYRPAGHGVWVGGDFYDAFATASGWMAVIGDVAGHGAEAAALTAQARHTLRAAATLTGDPAAAVTHLNDVLAARRRPALCTVCVVALPDPADLAQPARVVCAGHPLPIRVQDGRAEEVGGWGVMLGAEAGLAFTAHDVGLAAGAVLVLYTDGVLDARGGATRFGEQRLLATLAPATGASDAVGRVEAELDRFQTGDQADDTAVLAIQRTG